MLRDKMIKCEFSSPFVSSGQEQPRDCAIVTDDVTDLYF